MKRKKHKVLYETNCKIHYESLSSLLMSLSATTVGKEIASLCVQVEFSPGLRIHSFKASLEWIKLLAKLRELLTDEGYCFHLLFPTFNCHIFFSMLVLLG